jgi:hypothetical protein
MCSGQIWSNDEPRGMTTRIQDLRKAAAAYTRVRAVVNKIDSLNEQTTWDHPTFRISGRIFAALHDGGLILRSTEAEPKTYLRDPRFSLAPYWGRFGWVCTDITKVPHDELVQLLNDASNRVRSTRRKT